jgi:hypothetical protein
LWRSLWRVWRKGVIALGKGVGAAVKVWHLSQRGTAESGTECCSGQLIQDMQSSPMLRVAKVVWWLRVAVNGRLFVVTGDGWAEWRFRYP